jgi:hypothetical protein
MDSAFSLQMGACLADLPMYQKQFPNLVAKEIVQRMCLSNTALNYDGITMGQFVEGHGHLLQRLPQQATGSCVGH